MLNYNVIVLLSLIVTVQKAYNKENDLYDHYRHRRQMTEIVGKWQVVSCHIENSLTGTPLF